MIYIFHGDNTPQSYSAFSQNLDTKANFQKFKSDVKNFDIDQLSRFLNTASLFSENKAIIIENFFSLPKNTFDKAVNTINSHPEYDYLFWQSKKIEATKLKIFPKAEIKIFSLPETLFTCLNSLRPNNQKDFVVKYQNLLSALPFELILFWFKNTLRRQLTTYSKFSENKLKQAYLNLIELDYRSKNGQLPLSKEDSLCRWALNLMD